VGGELYLHAGSGHLVADASFADYNAWIAREMLARMLRFFRERT